MPEKTVKADAPALNVSLPVAAVDSPVKKTCGRPRKVPPASDMSALALSGETATTKRKAAAPTSKEDEPSEKKRRTRKASNTQDTTADADTTLAVRGDRARTKRTSGTTVTRRDPLPRREARNEHPGAREGVRPAARRAPSEMAAEREAVRLAAEEQIRKGKEAVEFLALMQLEQERRDAAMEVESEQRLSPLVRGRKQRNVPTEPESEGEEFLGVDSVDDSESSVEVVVEKVSINLQNQYR